MKQAVSFFLFVCMVSLLASAVVQAQEKKDVKIGYRAAKGEQVWIIVNRVKADKRESFEHFVRDYMYPAIEKLQGSAREGALRTRFLTPVRPNADSTYNYYFIMDPVLEDGDYSLTSVLTKAYGADKAHEYMQLFSDALAGQQIILAGKQEIN